jgi:hypothetical protein
MAEQVSFNINAELYENQFGELAIRFPGEKVFREVGRRREASFRNDAVRMLKTGEHPTEWREMPPHELLYGHNWHCISRMGFIEGDMERPALELDADPGKIGAQAKSYLREILH